MSLLVENLTYYPEEAGIPVPALLMCRREIDIDTDEDDSGGYIPFLGLPVCPS